MEIRDDIISKLRNGTSGSLAIKIKWGQLPKGERGDTIICNDFMTPEDTKDGISGRIYNLTVIPASADYNRMQSMVTAIISDLSRKTSGTLIRNIRWTGTAAAFYEDTTNRWQRPVEFEVYLSEK